MEIYVVSGCFSSSQKRFTGVLEGLMGVSGGLRLRGVSKSLTSVLEDLSG